MSGIGLPFVVHQGHSQAFLNQALNYHGSASKGRGRGGKTRGAGGGRGGGGGYRANWQTSGNQHGKAAAQLVEARRQERLAGYVRKEEKAQRKVAAAKDELKRDRVDARRMAKGLAATGTAKDAKSVYKSVNDQSSLKAALVKEKKRLKKATKAKKSRMKDAGVYDASSGSSDSSSSSSSDSSDSSSSESDEDGWGSDSSSSSSSGGKKSKKSKKSKKKSKKAKKDKAKKKKLLRKLEKRVEAYENAAAVGAAGGELHGQGAGAAPTIPPGSAEKVRVASNEASAAVVQSEVERLQMLGIVGRDDASAELATRKLMDAAKRGKAKGRTLAKSGERVVQPAAAAGGRSAAVQRAMRLRLAQGDSDEDGEPEHEEEEEAEEEWDDEGDLSDYTGSLNPRDVDWNALTSALRRMSHDALLKELFCETGQIGRIEGNTQAQTDQRMDVVGVLSRVYKMGKKMSVDEYANQLAAYKQAQFDWKELWPLESACRERREGKRQRKEEEDAAEHQKASARKRALRVKGGQPKTTAKTRATPTGRGRRESIEMTAQPSKSLGGTLCARGHTNKSSALACSRSGCDAPISVPEKRRRKRSRQVEAEIDLAEEEESEEDEEDEAADEAAEDSPDTDEEDELGDNKYEAALEVGMVSVDVLVSWGKPDVLEERERIWAALKQGEITDTTKRGVTDLWDMYERCNLAVDQIDEEVLAGLQADREKRKAREDAVTGAASAKKPAGRSKGKAVPKSKAKGKAAPKSKAKKKKGLSLGSAEAVPGAATEAAAAAPEAGADEATEAEEGPAAGGAEASAEGGAERG